MRWHTQIAGILTVLIVGLGLAPAASAASTQALVDDAPGLETPNPDTTQCVAVYPFCGGDAGEIVDYFVGQAEETVEETLDKLP